jgi:Methyltransferase domain
VSIEISLCCLSLRATTAHLLMSLGQTLFHRYLGHRGIGGRFLENHLHTHHRHYSGDRVVSENYLNEEANNTPFFSDPHHLSQQPRLQFVAMARAHSQCEVLHQDFLAMQLPESRFDGVFANASLFHVPSQELPRVLLELFKTLKPRGVLFSSNPRGNNEEGLSDDRYACFFDLDTWRDYVTSAGFVEVGHYYRPPGLPRHKQPWLATVWRKG